MTQTFISTLLLVGVIQGGLIGFGLLLYTGRKNGSHWLALGVLALSLTLLRLWTHAVGLESQPVFRRLPLSTDLAILPCFYLYILSLTAAQPVAIRRAFAWFVPWGLFMAYSVSVYMVSVGQESIGLMDALAERWHYPFVKRVEDYLTIGLNTFLGALIWFRVSRYHARIANWVPERLAVLLRILKIMMALAVITLLVNLSNFAANHILNLGDSNYIRQAAYVFYVVLIYIAGIIGFRLADLPQFPDAPDQSGSSSNPNPELASAYQRLQALMQAEQLFAEPDLNLNDLARRLSLTAPQASALIKQGSGKHFRAYVNDFRIESVKQKLADPEYRDCSILSIALESGFNSESSFYRVFKAATGLSPTAFRSRTSPVN